MEERYIYFCNVTNARFCNSVGFGGNYEDLVAAQPPSRGIHSHPFIHWIPARRRRRSSCTILMTLHDVM